MKEAQEVNKQVYGKSYNYENDGYVFVDGLGNLMHHGYITNEFPKLLKRSGLKHMCFHELRHRCASLLLANGVPMKQIQEWLGHSDFSNTANIRASGLFLENLFGKSNGKGHFASIRIWNWG